MFLLGIGDIFSDFLSELEITFDFDSVNFEMNSEDALKKGGRLKNSNPNEVQEFAAPFLTKALKTLWQSAKSLLAPSDLNKFKFLLKQALPILKKWK